LSIKKTNQKTKDTHNMKTYALTALAALSLAGCQKYAEVTTQPQAVNFTSAGVAEASIETAPSTVRSFTEGEQKNRVGEEIIGASCDLRGNGFDASFITPAILQLPRFQGAADPVNLRCTAQGKTGDQESPPVNWTLERIQQSSGQTSLLGVMMEAVVQGVATAARNPLNDEYGYSPKIGVIIPGTTVQ